MKIQHIHSASAGILNKIILVFFGIFLTSIVLSICLNLLEIPGLYLGTALNLFLAIYILKSAPNSPALKIIAYSIITTIVLGTIAFFIGFSYLKGALEGF